MCEINVFKISPMILALLVLVPGILGQGCSITDNPGQLITIYDVPTSGGPDVIATYHIQNALQIDNAFNEDMQEEYIGATLNDETLIIHKTDKFAVYAENESETSINFKVQFKCTVGNTQGTSNPYIFTIYLQVTNDNAPTFAQSEYRLVVPLPLPANFELTLYGAIYAQDIDLGDNLVRFTGGNGYFTAETIGRSSANPKEYYMSLKTARQILVLPQEVTKIEVTATDHGGLTGIATVQIQVDPENSYARDPSPTFEQPSYNFRIDENGNSPDMKCEVTEESYEDGEVTFTLSGKDRSYFIISEHNGRTVTVLSAGGPFDPEEEFKDRTYLQFELLATRTGYDTGHTTIFVDLPVDCSSDSPTTPSGPCTITTCPDADGPLFSKKVYTFRVYDGTVGNLGKVEAAIDDPRLLETLRYRLNYNDAPWLEDVIHIDEVSGSIELVEHALPANTNTFDIEVIATVEDEEVTMVGSARILVAFDKIDECSVMPVEKSLTFVTVKEEQKNSDIFPMTTADGCEYELLSVTPNEKEYLFVDENQKLCTAEIDRESESFGQMTAAQVQAKLKLVCPSEDLLQKQRRRRRRRAIDDFTDNVFTDEIRHQSDITHLNVFIEDINDNAPVFEHPSEAVTHLGYPDAELVGLLLPPYLIKVDASDADEGVNAQIEFSLSANSHFGIDSKSGVIFPLAMELGEEELTLTVRASDTVHVTSVELRVHRLTLDHLVVVYVENFGYHEIEEVVKLIQSQLGQPLQILKFANVPVHFQKKSVAMGRSTAGTNLKLITYAFNQNNQLVKANELVNKFEETNGGAAFTLTSARLEDEMPVGVVPEQPEGETDNGTFVAVIIALSVVVLVLLCGGFIGWWFWIRPTEWKHIEETTSVENVRVEPSSRAVDVTGRTADEMMEKERPSLNINGHTWSESSDAAPQLVKNITAADDSDSSTTSAVTPNATPRERKKSITFNENVERIEIETEVPVTVNTYQF